MRVWWRVQRSSSVVATVILVHVVLMCITIGRGLLFLKSFYQIQQSTFKDVAHCGNEFPVEFVTNVLPPFILKDEKLFGLEEVEGWKVFVP